MGYYDEVPTLPGAGFQCAREIAERADTRITALESALTVRDTEIARLETDLELARRDGGRYRFLKSQAPSVPGECRRRVAANVHDWARSLDPAAQFDMWAYEELSGDRLDVEIDAARAGNGGGV